LNIPQGQKPGKPEYGTTLWSFVFEPNTLDVQIQIENEIRRIAGQDPRLTLNSVVSYPQDNGILVEVEFAISPFNDVEQLAIRFDQNTTQAYSA
jgi:phage baseplate assembly protein W